MRIAVYHNLPYGGAHRVMCEQIRRLGGLVTDIFSIEGAATVCHPASGQHAFPFKPLKRFLSPFGRLNGLIGLTNLRRLDSLSRNIAAKVDALGADLVFAHNCRYAQTPPVIHHLATPVVYYCQEPYRAMHEAIPKGGPFLPVRDPFRAVYSCNVVRNEYDCLRRCKQVLSNSMYSRESLLRAYGVDSTVNYLGVDLEESRPTGATVRNRVLTVGRISGLKGHDFVIESISTIAPALRPSVCVVCGAGGGDRGKLVCLAERLGVEVSFQEDISDGDLRDLYAESLCTCAAPILEPFGLTPLESMACGTPVVGVAEGGIRETVVDGVTGFLVQRDAAAFGERIRKLADNPALRDEMGRAGRKHVELHWNWDKSITQLVGILKLAARGV